jgi:hypothetical protein
MVNNKLKLYCALDPNLGWSIVTALQDKIKRAFGGLHGSNSGLLGIAPLVFYTEKCYKI